MPLRLDASAADFEAKFAAFLNLRRAEDEDVDQAAARIIADVRARGDAALIELTKKYDRLTLSPAQLRIDDAEIDAAAAKAGPAERRALELAAKRIEAFHRRTLPADVDFRDEAGVRLGARYRPLDAVGIYVPGGLGAYPSSLLMNAIPAKVAGVARVAMAMPTPDGGLNPLVMLAARLAGVTEIYRVGGAQAVAALAYGTASIKPVDKITGPGNAWVAAAKRRVFGVVGIDLIAGPSEILVLADAANDPQWLAADLMSQAEHDPAAQAVLICDSAAFAERVSQAVDALIAQLPAKSPAGASWRDFGAIILVPSLEQGVDLANRIAPEHIEIATEMAAAEKLADRVRHAGAIFLGRHTPEAIGDYVAGTNHVLPTYRSARFSSGLGVGDFLKRTSIVGCDPAALAAIGPAAVTLAEVEGLPAHARSVAIRLQRKPG